MNKTVLLQAGKSNWKIPVITTLTQTSYGSIQLTNKTRKFCINNYVIKLTDVKVSLDLYLRKASLIPLFFFFPGKDLSKLS